ncbi:MAG: membrane or secreted protein [Crocinitomicaceae bacterium]|nr:membrane or secreted protein [Crocinitomicaceae bacterium]|tara:strand:+ start:14 stop:232 length:219 start_codon:yes stop_codon:yes gene_type:complete
MNWTGVLVAIGLLALAFAGIAIKILVKKDGEFSGTCASNSPFLNPEGESCSFCGALPGDRCKSENDSDKAAA